MALNIANQLIAYKCYRLIGLLLSVRYTAMMFKTKFGREVTIILLIKLTLLYSLWNVCFKDTKHKISGEVLAAKLL